ncbi:MAG: PhoH family protein [Methylomicrobium sp.]|nr:PhoH family protein [Methylomicrobium sp.]
MTKGLTVKVKRQKRSFEKRKLRAVEPLFEEIAPLSDKKHLEPIRAINEAQGHYLCSIQQNIITFGIGPAGTGKSYVAGGYAADQLRDKLIDKIIVTRPCVEAGESLGFLPGELEDKFAPYIDPFREILNERLGKSFVDYLIKHKRIDARPLAYMRGITFKNCMVILDEAQNTTPTQMKLFLTRIGENCKVIIDGDIQQKDIRQQSGLADAINRLDNVRRVGIVNFDTNDIVRSKIVKDIIKAYG